MKKILLFVSIVGLTNLAFAKEKESPFMQEATINIKNQMKDPESTQFRNLREIQNTLNEKSLCGEINSKNSYGGYVGYMPFSYSKEGTAILNHNAGGYKLYLNLAIYNKSGCGGEKQEILARNPQMYTNYCEVAYQLFSDVIAEKQPRELAIETAMSTYKQKKLDLFNNDLDKAKADLLLNLDQVSANPEVIKKISKKNSSFKKQYMTQCPLMMRNAPN